MGGLKKYYFGKSKYKPNTFIGGVSATLNTPALVASKLGISVSRIKAFSIIRSDIQFAVIGGSYSMPNSCWKNDTTITYYDDRSGLCTTLIDQSFRSNPNLTFVNFPKLTTINNYNFEGSALAGTIDFPMVTTAVGAYLFKNMVGGAVTINLPNTTSIGGTDFLMNIYSKDVTVNVPLVFKTSNAGKPHASLTNPAISVTLVNYIGWTDSTSYNTEIGGLAASHPTKQLIAKRIGIGSGGIVNFQVVGSNLRFEVLAQYSLKANAFNANSATVPLTYYDDIGMNVTYLQGSSIYSCNTLQWLKFNGIVNQGGDSIIRNCPNLVSVEMNNLVSCSASPIFRDCWSIGTINLPELVNMTGNMYSAGANTYNLPKCTTLGATVGQDNVFAVIKTGAIINVPISLQTANAGAPDGDLVYASGTRGATIVYV